jgi:hypothetical protein
MAKREQEEFNSMLDDDETIRPRKRSRPDGLYRPAADDRDEESFPELPLPRNRRINFEDEEESRPRGGVKLNQRNREEDDDDWQPEAEAPRPRRREEPEEEDYDEEPPRRKRRVEEETRPPAKKKKKPEKKETKPVNILFIIIPLIFIVAIIAVALFVWPGYLKGSDAGGGRTGNLPIPQPIVDIGPTDIVQQVIDLVDAPLLSSGVAAEYQEGMADGNGTFVDVLIDHMGVLMPIAEVYVGLDGSIQYRDLLGIMMPYEEYSFITSTLETFNIVVGGAESEPNVYTPIDTGTPTAEIGGLASAGTLVEQMIFNLGYGLSVEQGPVILLADGTQSVECTIYNGADFVCYLASDGMSMFYMRRTEAEEWLWYDMYEMLNWAGIEIGDKERLQQQVTSDWKHFAGDDSSVNYSHDDGEHFWFLVENPFVSSIVVINKAGAYFREENGAFVGATIEEFLTNPAVPNSEVSVGDAGSSAADVVRNAYAGVFSDKGLDVRIKNNTKVDVTFYGKDMQVFDIGFLNGEEVSYVIVAGYDNFTGGVLIFYKGSFIDYSVANAIELLERGMARAGL